VTEGPSSLVFKTPGWVFSYATRQNIIDTSTYQGFTVNGRYAWGLVQQTELLGSALQEEVLFPQGWSVQEATGPRGYVERIINNVARKGLPWGCEVHDVWSTVPITEEMFRRFVGYYDNAQQPPAMEKAQMGQNEGLIPYLDFEQVIGVRSRNWMGDTMGMVLNDFDILDPIVRQMPSRKTHDMQWGSGEAIASQDIYHIRIVIAQMDTQSGTGTQGTEFYNNSAWFTIIPPSIQPMLTYADKPPFVARITMERRSKNV